MDIELLLIKLDSLKRSVERIESRRPVKRQELDGNYDIQDILSVNLERVVQVSVDIALHVLTDQNERPPETMSDAFQQLGKSGIVNADIAAHLSGAVGFRNVAVH